ncbi:DUF1450 domain-containing protein [Clostridium sp. 1001271B_151109_B4]|uniref:DUF1450 domain-containing protein n=1 Tax=Clostridium sp. 1001271B_151109_B4 TaxID=2787148 RepID=UPI0018AA7D45|nr:DUF1450 domain-containing protein [Clostridium sp. 1001271B_151109_B4]
MIVMCPGCSGIDPELVKKEFKDEKIVFGCIGECGGRMDESIVAMINGEFVEANSEVEFINKVKNILSVK